MFISWWALVIFIILYSYLIVADVRLYRRVQKLEAVICKLEGVAEKHHQYHKYDKEDVS